MRDDQTEILSEVASYYARKLESHGPTAQGVDWNGAESQTLRFRQLCRLLEGCAPNSFSLNDLGCGYGALLDFLCLTQPPRTYLGCDLVPAMVQAALERHLQTLGARFLVAGLPDEPADFGVASGIFNVRQTRSDAEWKAFIYETMDILHETSVRGFSFNCLTAYSDAHLKRSYLYYANPLEVFDRCKRRYAKNVALLHDYDLYEFTILVRKESP